MGPPFNRTGKHQYGWDYRQQKAGNRKELKNNALHGLLNGKVKGLSALLQDGEAQVQCGCDKPAR